MKKSNQVSVSLIVGLAASLTAGGCSTGGYNECHDEYGRVIPNTECSTGRRGSRWVHIGGFGRSGSYGGSFFGG